MWPRMPPSPTGAGARRPRSSPKAPAPPARCGDAGGDQATTPGLEQLLRLARVQTAQLRAPARALVARAVGGAVLGERDTVAPHLVQQRDLLGAQLAAAARPARQRRVREL